MRVSTAGMNNQMITQSLRVQSSYAEALEQQSSELKSAQLSGLDGQAGAAVGLTADIARSKHLVTQAETATAQLEIAYSTVDSIGDLVQGVLSKLAGAIDGTTDDYESVQTAAADALSNIVTLLNTQYAGSYLFSGGTTLTKPVDVTDPAYDPTLNTAYYQGGSNLRTVMLDGGASVSYGVTADDPAFAEAMKGLAAIADAAPLDGATVESAFDTLSATVKPLGHIQEKLSAQTVTLNNLIDAQTDFQLYANEMLTGLTKVDIPTASAVVSQRELLLQASFSALSSLKSVSILNYL